VIAGHKRADQKAPQLGVVGNPLNRAAIHYMAGREFERAAIRDEGYDPDHPKVIAALDRVREMRGIQLGRSSVVRAWSIWSYAYVTIAAVVIVSPLRARDS
jgi:hypothetical protein